MARDVWTPLASALDGSLIPPGDENYDTARLLFNGRFDDLRPAAVAQVAHASDVVECLAYARAHDVPIAVRSGGHSYEGWSSGDGRLVIDVRHLDSVDAASGRVGAGAQLGQVYDVLGANGRTIPAGTCPTVGVAGLTLGGGHGLLCRTYGPTTDSLTGATVVTADGAIRECSPESDADLFWALRGAGNGHFGVVTDLLFQTYDAPDTVGIDLSWPWAQVAEAVDAWQDWAPDLPDRYWSTLRMGHGDGEPVVKATVVSLGPMDELEAAVDRLACPPVPTATFQHTWLDTVRRFGGETPTASPTYAARSAFAERSLGATGIATLVDSITRANELDGLDEVSIAVTALGGAFNRREPLATAFVHRRHRLLLQAEAYWGGADQCGVGWLTGWRDAIRPHVSGSVYQNCPDPTLADWRTAYYGPATRILSDLKEQVDPDRLFTCPQPVSF